MKGTPLNTLPKESVDAIVRSTERIEGAASILAMLKEKADGGRVTPSEIAAVRCVLKSCAAELDGAWARESVKTRIFPCGLNAAFPVSAGFPRGSLADARRNRSG